MSFRRTSLLVLGCGLMGAIAFSQALNADPLTDVDKSHTTIESTEPTIEPTVPTPRATQHRFARRNDESNSRREAPSLPQVTVKAIFYKVDTAKLTELADQTVNPVGEFLKQHGLVPKNPEASRTTSRLALSDHPLSFELGGQNVEAAFERIASPTLRTLTGQKSVIQIGQAVPAPQPAPTAEPGVETQVVGWKFSITPNLMDHGVVSLNTLVEYAQAHAGRGHEASATASKSGKAGAISRRAVHTTLEVKSGQHLFIAFFDGESNVTEIMQMVPLLVTPVPATASRTAPRASAFAPTSPFESPEPAPASVAKLSAAPETDTPEFAAPKTEVSEADVPEHTDPAPHVTTELPSSPVSTPAQADEFVNGVVYRVQVYEIDHAELLKNNGNLREKYAELFKDLRMNGSGLQVENGAAISAWMVKNSKNLEQFRDSFSPGVRIVADPKIFVRTGQTGSFDYGGKVPQLVLSARAENGSVRAAGSFRPLATEFMVETLELEHDRIRMALSFDPVEKKLNERSKQTSAPEKPASERRIRAVAELAIGQSLCLSDFNQESPVGTESLLVTITPEAFKSDHIKLEPVVTPVPVAVPEVNQELVVEDRWPLGDVKVGQRVVLAPVWLTKTSLSTSYSLMAFAAEASTSIRIEKIEPMPGQKGRKLFLRIHSANQAELTQPVMKMILDMLRSATTVSAIPVEQISLHDFRWVDDIYHAIDPAQRPRPVEINVGETFIATGVQGVVPKAEPPHQTLGGFSLDFLDDDLGGAWKATAMNPGLTRLIQLQAHSDGELMAQIRRTEYHVKADTRELEMHLAKQFPTAKVSVTSVGRDALILTGTVNSEQELKTVSELAHLFSNCVLSRVTVKTATGKTTQAPPVKHLWARSQPAIITHGPESSNEISTIGEIKSSGVETVPASARSVTPNSRMAPPRSPRSEPSNTRTPSPETAKLEPGKSETANRRTSNSNTTGDSTTTARGQDTQAEVQQLRDEVRELRRELQILLEALATPALETTADQTPALETSEMR